MQPRTRHALDGILAFADELHQYVVSAGEEHFYRHRPTQLVAEALLHRIGEAVSRLDDTFLAEHTEVAWQKIKRMRNVVAHQYGFIDYHIVWRALVEALPADVMEIRRILDTA